MKSLTAFTSRVIRFASMARAPLLLGSIVLAGCTTPMDPATHAQYQGYASTANRPAIRPVRSMSSFSDSLACMDRLFRDANLPTTLVTSKSIPDYSSKVSVASKDMIITALSQMSRKSNAFRYVDFEVDIARQDTVQNLTNILLNNNQIQLQRPALYISGAVSFVDQSIITNRNDIGTSASRLETGFSGNKSATLIGMELHLGDFRTRTLIPGVDSANEVAIGNGGQGMDLAGLIGDYGWQFSVGRDYNQGTGAAVRTLVELGVIELMGKWARVPYWQCLTLEQSHPLFQRQLREWFNEGDDSVHQGLVRKSLIAKGYLKDTPESQPANSLAFRRALGRFQADRGMVVTGVVDFTTYERALSDFVALDANGALTRYGWMSKDPAPVQPDNQPGSPVASSDKAYGVSDGPRTMDLQVENVLLGRKDFQSGEQVFLSATVSRASYMACYLADAVGHVMRLLPNSVSPNTALPANQAMRIPDWMSPNPGFVLTTANPGTEAVVCMATDEDVMEKLPASIQASALTHMPDVHSVDDVVKAYTDTLGAEGFTQQTVSWTVVPARPTAAAAPKK